MIIAINNVDMIDDIYIHDFVIYLFEVKSQEQTIKFDIRNWYIGIGKKLLFKNIINLSTSGEVQIDGNLMLTDIVATVKGDKIIFDLTIDCACIVSVVCDYLEVKEYDYFDDYYVLDRIYQNAPNIEKQIFSNVDFDYSLLIKPKKRKECWEACAKILVKLTDEKLRPYYSLLLEYACDIDDPGSNLIYCRLKNCNDYKFYQCLVNYKETLIRQGNSQLLKRLNHMFAEIDTIGGIIT